MVETPSLQAKPNPAPSPWMGEGGDGGERFGMSPPPFSSPVQGEESFPSLASSRHPTNLPAWGPWLFCHTVTLGHL